VHAATMPSKVECLSIVQARLLLIQLPSISLISSIRMSFQNGQKVSTRKLHRYRVRRMKEEHKK